MSYVEDAIYSFIQKILTRGLIILTNKRFLLYSILAVILPILLTVYSFIQGGVEVTTTYLVLFRLELAVCVALIITGLISLKINLVRVELLFFLTITALLFSLSFWLSDLVSMVENVFVFVSFYSWIITTNFATLMAIREFMVSWPGWVIRLGDEDERITFSPIVKLGVFASIAYFIYSLITYPTWSLVLAFLAGAIVIYTIYVFKPVTKDSIITSIIAFFYFSLLYHLFVRAETSTGFLLMDILLIVGTTIFTAQSISRLIESKKASLPYHWDSLIILLLGFMLGYHLLGVRIAFFSGLNFLYSLYHDIAFGFGTLMIFGLLILYTVKPTFMSDFSKQQITVGYAARKISGAGLEAVTNYARELKEGLKKGGWKFELKKPKEGQNQDLED